MSNLRMNSLSGKFCFAVSISLLLHCFAASTIWAQSRPAPVLIKVIDAKGQSLFGELVAEDDQKVDLIELKTGKKHTFQKSALNDFRKGVSEKEVAGNIGLANYLVWGVRRVIPSAPLAGTIAQIDPPAIYVTLGSQAGVEKGQELIVFRSDEDIKDPKEGSVLGTSKKLIAKLTVTEALEKLSKCKLDGDFDVELKVGDGVELAHQSKLIAVLPFVDLKGDVRAGGRKLGEDLTTGLIQGGIRVVERTLLGKVLVELGLQNTALFDPDKAQRLGKQLGAHAILTGTLTTSGYYSDANLRLIKVETGEILFATRQTGPGLGNVVSPGSETVIITPGANGPATIIDPASANAEWKSLFNGKDLTGWRLRNPQSKPPWTAQNGMLVGFGPRPVRKEHNDIYTVRTFWNFSFRCEFMISKGGNSGIYLRGRHEIQILDDYDLGTLTVQSNGALWGAAQPSQFASHPSGQWQTIEATIIGNKVTIILNGKMIINGAEYVPLTGTLSAFALDTNIHAPGPILLQGHTGTVRFRNIQIREIK